MESPKRKKVTDTEDLIRLVRERKCLWDRTHAAYRDRHEKDKAWAEIYKDIEPEYDKLGKDMKNLIGMQITKKWYNVRDSYVKSRKFHNIRHKPYLHSKLLDFLDPIYLDKSTEDSRCETRSDNDDNEEQWLNEVFVVDDDGVAQHEAKRPKIEYDKPDETTTNDAEESIVNVLANLINKEDDEDRAFFRSIMPAVKRLSDESKLEFRILIMKILKNLIGKDKNVLNMKHEGGNNSDTDSR